MSIPTLCFDFFSDEGDETEGQETQIRTHILAEEQGTGSVSHNLRGEEARAQRDVGLRQLYSMVKALQQTRLLSGIVRDDRAHVRHVLLACNCGGRLGVDWP